MNSKYIQQNRCKKTDSKIIDQSKSVNIFVFFTYENDDILMNMFLASFIHTTIIVRNV